MAESPSSKQPLPEEFPHQPYDDDLDRLIRIAIQIGEEEQLDPPVEFKTLLRALLIAPDAVSGWVSKSVSSGLRQFNEAFRMPMSVGYATGISDRAESGDLPRMKAWTTNSVRTWFLEAAEIRDEVDARSLLGVRHLVAVLALNPLEREGSVYDSEQRSTS